jgi:type II secretory pathway pseudopilin PulG
MRRRHAKQSGFSLIELLVIISIIICLLLISRLSFWSILQKSKQVDTMANMDAVGQIMMSCLIDDLITPLGASTPVDIANYASADAAVLEDSCRSFVGKGIRKKDGWGCDFEYYFNDPKVNNLSGREPIFMIRSPGMGCEFELVPYVIGTFANVEYESDIVWADGSFVRSPNW